MAGMEVERLQEELLRPVIVEILQGAGVKLPEQGAFA